MGVDLIGYHRPRRSKHHQQPEIHHSVGYSLPTLGSTRICPQNKFAPEPDEEAGFEPIKHHTVGVGVLILHP
ncbi:hypothetical protein VTJ04DRAFT_6171 [Mycothermus thermophilus]|uniref:uncharacterized protein n=1 Tax=Humicola insolens TaxID=85995 RepID=UPI0037429DF3